MVFNLDNYAFHEKTVACTMIGVGILLIWLTLEIMRKKKNKKTNNSRLFFIHSVLIILSFTLIIGNVAMLAIESSMNWDYGYRIIIIYVWSMSFMVNSIASGYLWPKIWPKKKDEPSKEKK